MGWRPILGIAAATVAAVAAAWLFGLPELAALAFAAWAATSLAAVLLATRTRVPVLDIRLHPTATHRGQPARLELTFTSPANTASTQTRLYGRLGSAGNGIIAVGRLAEGTSTVVSIDLPTTRRGLVTVGPLSLRTTDPLGWWYSERGVGSEPILVVRPMVHDLEHWPGRGGRDPAAGRHSGATPTGVDSDEDLVGLRPYVPGDDLRRVHWRTSARRNEPYVVQVEPPVQSPGVTVILDQSGASAPDFELAVEAAASVLVAAASSGRPVRLALSHDHTVLRSSRLGSPGPGSARRNMGSAAPGDVEDLLDRLATVDRHGVSESVPAIDESQGSDTVVLCSSGPSAVGPHGFGRVDLVVACGAQSGGPPGAEDLVRWDGQIPLGAAWQAGLVAESVRR